jgi:hypothetical protein
MIHVAKTVRKYTVAFAIAVTPTPSEEVMQALQVTAFGTLFSAAFIGLIYGEILLLNRR